MPTADNHNSLARRDATRRPAPRTPTRDDLSYKAAQAGWSVTLRYFILTAGKSLAYPLAAIIAYGLARILHIPLTP